MDKRAMGPYRDPPRLAIGGRLAGSGRRCRWIGLTIAASALGLGLVAAPQITASILGALFLYVLAPWFITRAPGR